MPPDRVGYVDGYGNLKTTIASGTGLGATSASGATGASGSGVGGSRVRVRIGEVELEAVVSDGSFAVEPGQLAFAPGSSGWPGGRGREVRWMELFLRGGSAWEAFGRPGVGAQMEVRGG